MDRKTYNEAMRLIEAIHDKWREAFATIEAHRKKVNSDEVIKDD